MQGFTVNISESACVHSVHSEHCVHIHTEGWVYKNTGAVHKSLQLILGTKMQQLYEIVT